jgi:hypothetical protein
MSWTRYLDENGMPEQTGTEGGVILADDEHGLGARITLEKNGAFAPFAITCGIYEWMMHTRFCSTLAAAQSDYHAMKIELANILDAIPMRTDPDVDVKSASVADAISAFVDKFP